MDMIQRFFPSTMINSLISSMNNIDKSERLIAFNWKQLFGLQFLEFINYHHSLQDPLSAIFDNGKQIVATFESSISQKTNLAPKFSVLKEKQLQFGKLKKLKKSYESELESNKRILSQKQEHFDKVKKSNASSIEINKAYDQLHEAQLNHDVALSNLVQCNNIYDQEELVYYKTLYELLITPLHEWAMSEINQNQELVKVADDFSKCTSDLYGEVSPDPELQNLLNKLNEELSNFSNDA